MRVQLSTLPRRLVAATLSVVAGVASAQPVDVTVWNRSAAPTAPYGPCYDGPTAQSSKLRLPAYLGETAQEMVAIQILECGPYTAGSGITKIPCDRDQTGGVPYAWCARSPNDGLGNDVTIGVLKRDARTDATGHYTGCPDGATLRPKLDLVRAAGLDPRRVNAIVTLSCKPATVADKTAPAKADCPREPQPYAQCISTPNDGYGNAVKLGLVRVDGPGDPYGLYGECDPVGGILPGFLYKADAVTQVGRSLANVTAIEVNFCSPGAKNDPLHVVDCASIWTYPPALAVRYDYCIQGSDKYRNAVTFGVIGK